MADYAENVVPEHSGSEDGNNANNANNGRSGPGLFSLHEYNFTFPLSGIEIGGHPRAYGSRQSATVDHMPNSGRFTSIQAVPKVEKMEDDIPINNIPPRPAEAAVAPGGEPAAALGAEPVGRPGAVTEPARVVLDDDIEIVSPIEVLDSHGDLIFVAGKGAQRCEFRVCSRTVFRASPYLKELYYREDVDAPRRSRSRESPSRQSPGHRLRQDLKDLRRIELDRIDVKAFHLVLLIIHGEFQKALDKLKGQALFSEVVVVAHHYDMVNILAPVATKWLKKVYNEDHIRHDKLARQLWITHMLGHLRCVKQTTSRMICTARLNSKDELVGRGASDNEPYVMHQTLMALNIMDSIKFARHTVMEKLVSFVHNTIENLTCSPEPSELRPHIRYVCSASVGGELEQARCDSMMLGAITRALRGEKWENIDMRLSPERVYRKIQNAAEKTAELYQHQRNNSHAQCSPFGQPLVSLEDIVRVEIEKIPWDVAHFTERAMVMSFKLKDETE